MSNMKSYFLLLTMIMVSVVAPNHQTTIRRATIRPEDLLLTDSMLKDAYNEYKHAIETEKYTELDAIAAKIFQIIIDRTKDTVFVFTSKELESSKQHLASDHTPGVLNRRSSLSNLVSSLSEERFAAFEKADIYLEGKILRIKSIGLRYELSDDQLQLFALDPSDIVFSVTSTDI